MYYKLPVLALLSLAAAQYSNGTVVTITSDIVVTEFTTYCPEATTFSTNNITITVTGPTTLTITDCPCTIPTTTTSFESTEVPESTTPESTVPTVTTVENVAAQYGVQAVAVVAAVVAALV